MGSVRKEVERFNAWLRGQSTTPDTRRMANLVLGHLAELIPLGTASGAKSRSKCLVAKAQCDFDETSDELPLYQEDALTVENPWKRLHHLQVGPFRGFMRPEPFELDKRVVLIYGPNGSGKSSLCEALEYALMGSVGEADVKRIQPASNYLVNARVNRFEPPVLSALGHQGEEVAVMPDADAFRFCFVEKNRIDDFSRLAAKTPAERVRLIATLFGVDGFDEFVRGFNESLDRHIATEGGNRKALEVARLALKADEQLIAEEASKREDLRKSGETIADSFEKGLTLDLVETKIGTTERPGLLQAIEHRLEQPVPSSFNLTVLGIQQGFEHSQRLFGEAASLRDELAKRRDDLSFKQLFRAVLDLKEQAPSTCPACDTPLTGPGSVRINPYKKAEDGLEQLSALATLEDQYHQAKVLASTASKDLRASLGKVLDFLSLDLAESELKRSLTDLPEEPQGNWWFDLVFEKGLWEPILEAARRIEGHDQAIAAEETTREGLRTEKARLRAILDQILAQRTLVGKLDKDLVAARARIAKFDEDHLAEIEALPEEDRTIAMNKRIQKGYEGFLPLLRQYRDALPGTLVADLNETAMNLYNSFNCNDHATDKLVSLQLPLTGESRIELVFAGDPETPLDALHILSEGHIRCLGLAILVAKNLQQDCPFLLFDDAVNAIDHDHKEGIRNTLFMNSLLKDKQIILTCHGEEFIKEIENMLGGSTVKDDCRSYVFLPHDGDNAIRVNAHPKPRNYLLAMEQMYSQGEMRDAHAKARQAVEAMNAAVWNYLRKHNLGELTLNIPGPKGHYEANDVASKIRKALKTPTFQDLHKELLIQGYDVLLDAQNWAAFNGGTHETQDREDFDRGRFKIVMDTMKAMDQCLHGSSRP